MGQNWNQWSFLKDLITIAGSTCSQALKIQLHHRVIEGFLSFLPFVNSFYSSPAIHSDHITRTFSLNGLLSDTSKGCNWLVRPPGIIATSVLWFCNCFVFWTCRRLTDFFSSKGLPHEISIPVNSFIPPSSIHPFSWTWTTIWGGMGSFGNVFLFSISNNLNGTEDDMDESDSDTHPFVDISDNNDECV